VCRSQIIPIHSDPTIYSDSTYRIGIGELSERIARRQCTGYGTRSVPLLLFLGLRHTECAYDYLLRI
jgi:hypothetical protein